MATKRKRDRTSDENGPTKNDFDHYLRMPHISNLQRSTKVQQDDSSYEFYKYILDYGIPATYKKYGYHDTFKVLKLNKQPKLKQKHVIIIGAGVCGLSAAYELMRAGIRVTVIEIQNRIGGRMKTITEGLSPGLHAEGGAMRIPDDHYLTHGYIDKFGISVRDFNNKNLEGKLLITGHDAITLREWEDENEKYSNKFFEGWDGNVPPEEREYIKGIRDYFDRTIAPVKQELIDSLNSGANPKKVWDDWVRKWSVMSLREFLLTDIKQDKKAPKLRPWTFAAFQGHIMSTYDPMYEINLVEALRDDLGGWWVDKLKTPVYGMSQIAEGFIDRNVNGNIDLAAQIMHGNRVMSVKKVNQPDAKVIVKATNAITGQVYDIKGDAAIVTVPLPVMRQMEMDVNAQRLKALSNIHYEASTKIILQCRTRFWENQVGQGKGGFSKTNLPIGQVLYPSQGDPVDNENKRGILVVYTWGQDAVLFGSQPPKDAIESAVKEVAHIHSKIVDEFEVGVVQAWQNDPFAQGAFAALLPNQYADGLKELMKHSDPNDPIYLAGEAISFANAWIQGAIESGLRAAYLFYCNQIGNPVSQ